MNIIGAFLVGTGLGAILFFGWLWAVLFVIAGVAIIGRGNNGLGSV